MKQKTLIAALIAIAMGSSGIALAQRAGDRNDDRKEQSQRDDRDGRDNRDRQANDRRDNRDGNENRDNRGREGDGHENRGAGPNHNFYKGQRLPAQYHNKYYVVDDWRGHQLSAPPRGYHWVQTGGDYVLVAIATGLIAQLLLGN